jgi:hypothetical protein
MTTINQKCNEYVKVFVERKWSYKNVGLVDIDELYNDLIKDVEEWQVFSEWLDYQGFKIGMRESIDIIKKIVTPDRSFDSYRYSEIVSKYAKQFYENNSPLINKGITDSIDILDLEWTTEVKNLKKEFDDLMLVNPDFKKWVLDGNSFTRGVNNSFGMAETCVVNEIEFNHVKDVFDSGGRLMIF